ncbi:EthD family reductase [Pseudarthrobacter oxydans]|uniref:EthD family reductase n=1 Tax=Pseudarthrobacter oxydans TaxID=1671 RepID=UPI00381975AB
MHDVFVLYNHPDRPQEFDAHYRDVHSPLVNELPKLREFTWGKPSEDDRSYYVVARLTYDSAADAAESMASPAGQKSVDDLANFAGAGVTVLNTTRAG